MSLTKKMILGIILLLLVPIGVLGSISYIYSAKALENSARDEAMELTKMNSKLVNYKIESIQDLIAVLTVNEQVKDLITRKNQLSKIKVESTFNNMLDRNEGFIESIHVINHYGNYVASSSGINPNHTHYLDTTLNLNAGFISGVWKDVHTSKKMFSVVEPIIINDNIEGLIIAYVNFEIIESIIDQSGMILVHPESSKEFKTNLYEENNESLNILLDEMTSGNNGDGYYSYNGEYKYAAFSSIRHWTLVSTANYDDYMHTATQLKNTTIIVSMMMLIISVIVAYVYARKSIIIPITKIVTALTAAGSGDYTNTLSIESKDEIGLLSATYNSMITIQNNSIQKIYSTSDELMRASNEMLHSSHETFTTTEEISARVENIANDAYEQMLAIENTREHFSDMLISLEILDNHSKIVNQQSDNTITLAKAGQVSVEEAVNTINEIDEISNNTVSVLSKLEKKADKVSDISQTINKIADSISLLALNATIEAARAGEHGKSFAVVAEEVRKLSEETSIEAENIRQTLNQILEDVKETSQSIHKSRSHIAYGVQTVSKANQSFNDIHLSVGKVGSSIDEIQSKTGIEISNANNLSSIMEQVGEMAQKISSFSQEIVASVEEQTAITENMTQASESTQNVTESLVKSVSKFKIN